MDLREGDLAESLNIWSSCGAALYSLICQSVLPGGLLQFGFSKCPAGRPCPIDKPASADRSGDRTRPPTAASSGRRIDRPWPACQLDSAARQESSKNQILLGHPAGRYEKSNSMRKTRGRTVYFDFWPSPPPSVPYGLCTSLRPKWSFQDQGNGTLIGIDDVWVKKNISFRPRTKKM